MFNDLKETEILIRCPNFNGMLKSFNLQGRTEMETDTN